MIVRRLLVLAVALLLCSSDRPQCGSGGACSVASRFCGKAVGRPPVGRDFARACRHWTSSHDRAQADRHARVCDDGRCGCEIAAWRQSHIWCAACRRRSGDNSTRRRRHSSQLSGAIRARCPPHISSPTTISARASLLEGLKQTVTLARLSPGGAQAAAPFLAAYAQDRANWPEMRALFRSQAWLEGGVLAALARDPRNTDAILALSDANHRTPDSDWLPVLLSSLITSGDYARARAIWSSIGGGHAPVDSLFDAGFSAPEPPPPFNWSLASSTIGLAERQPGGRLHAIFYGNVDGVLASQLVLLPAGNLSDGDAVGRLAGPSRSAAMVDPLRQVAEPVASAAVDEVASRGWEFQVPADCAAQWLELSGRSGDIAQQSDVTITGLTLKKAGPNA